MNGASSEPVLAIFWDIENCAVPKGKTPAAVAHCIREQFSSYAKEVEFLCVCDVTRERSSLVSSLNDAQVTVVHVGNEHKNAADDKIKQLMRKFCDSHKPPVTLVLISGDVDFAADLSHMKNHHKYNIILVHNKVNVKPALAYSANKIFSFEEVIKNAPEKDRMTPGSPEEAMHLVVIKGLPMNVELPRVKAKLAFLVNNTKGSVIQCSRNMAIARYSKSSHAARAAKRLQQQDLYGSKLSTIYTTNATSEEFDERMQPGLAARSGQMDFTVIRTPSRSRYPSLLHTPECDRSFTTSTPEIHSQENWEEEMSSPDNRFYQYDQRSYTDSMRLGSRSLCPASPSDMKPLALPRPISSRLAEGERAEVFNFTGPHHKPFTSTEEHQTADTPTATLATCARVTFIVRGLSRRISATTWGSTLMDFLQKHTPVLEMEVVPESDDSWILRLQVAANKAAYVEAICSDLVIHDQSILPSRVKGSREPSMPRIEVSILLHELSGESMNIQQLIQEYKQSFQGNITEAEIRAMRETVKITDGEDGAMVSLRNLSFPHVTQSKQLAVTPYCTRHCCQDMHSLATALGMQLYVRVERESFARQLCALLIEHSGSMHLASFPFCYEGAYGKLMPCYDGGVLLEQLISSIKGVRIRSDSGNKIICLDDCADASLQNAPGPDHREMLSQFAREVVSLLNALPNSQMSLARLAPSYKMKFNRELRVEDYGYTNLEDLLSAIPHILQVLGNDKVKTLHLTYGVHLKRFIVDLSTVLKVLPGSCCTVKELPMRYMQVTGNALSLASYGMCYMNDVLPDLSANGIQVEGAGEEAIISLPDKDSCSVATPRQILEEQRKMARLFSCEVIGILKKKPQCTMPFNKFIPAYHHHFGRQCRVADYGFSKLLELFEAIPDVVSVTNSGEARQISLTVCQLEKMLAVFVLAILKRTQGSAVSRKQLEMAWQRKYEFDPSKKYFPFQLVGDPMRRLAYFARQNLCARTDMVTLINQSYLERLACWCFEILMLKSNGRMKVEVFRRNFQSGYGAVLELDRVKSCLHPAIKISRGEQMTISLHPLLHAARRYICLLKDYGKMEVSRLETIYRCRFGDEPGCYNFAVMLEILRSAIEFDKQTVSLRPGYIARLAEEVVYRVGIYVELIDWDTFFGEPSEPSRGNMSRAVPSGRAERLPQEAVERSGLFTLDEAGKALGHLEITRTNTSQ